MKTKNDGVTLIALVITIIVLLILAGIVISILIKNGIFEKAILARDRYLRESMKEEVQFIIMEAQIQEGDSLTYECLCNNYLVHNNYYVENFGSFAKIKKNTNEYEKSVLYIDTVTFELMLEKKYEVCKVILQTDNDFNNFEDIDIVIKDTETGKIIQEYTLADENEHDFFITTGTKYTVSVSELKNEIYEYTTPIQTDTIEALENSTREINLVYKEKRMYLYNYGFLGTLITGGWDNKFKVNNALKYIAFDPIFNTDNITLSLSETLGTECVISTINKIDLTNYLKVCINYEYDVKPAFSRPLCVFTDKEDFPSSYVAQITNNDCKNGISSIDISGIKGSYYIGSGIWNSHSTTAIENSRIIYQIWLEK